MDAFTALSTPLYRSHCQVMRGGTMTNVAGGGQMWPFGEQAGGSSSNSLEAGDLFVKSAAKLAVYNHTYCPKGHVSCFHQEKYLCSKAEFLKKSSFSLKSPGIWSNPDNMRVSAPISDQEPSVPSCLRPHNGIHVTRKQEHFPLQMVWQNWNFWTVLSYIEHQDFWIEIL